MLYEAYLRDDRKNNNFPYIKKYLEEFYNTLSIKIQGEQATDPSKQTRQIM